MKLDELFVSHKQVEPVSFDYDTPELPNNIYLNLNRAQKAVLTDSQEDVSSWKVGDSKPSAYNWKVIYSKPNNSPTDIITSIKGDDYYTKLRNFIIQEENFSPEAYIDGKYYSIGYGFNDPKYKKGDTMTREEADIELDRQLKTREAKYKKRFGSKWDNLSDNQRIALMSYGYNTGDGNIIGGDVAKYLDTGDMEKLRDSLRINTFQGKVLEGLENRRKLERTLFDN